jgi:hypothetical protein
MRFMMPKGITSFFTIVIHGPMQSCVVVAAQKGNGSAHINSFSKLFNQKKSANWS